MTGTLDTLAAARQNTVWIAPSATRFACLCELCLDSARESGLSFLDGVRLARVQGILDVETDVGFVRCAAGHPVVARRVDRPPNLVRRNASQLELV